MGIPRTRGFEIEFLLKTDPKDTGVIFVLRVEVLLKTDGGYPRDAEITLFTLTNPGSSLCLTPNGQVH